MASDLSSEVCCAIICHEANRALCQAFGDDSQPTWENAPQWQKKSAVLGVRFVRDNRDAPPSANHQSWLEQKLKDGWVYGEVKDPEARTHPCIVPFHELPPEQQAKDHVFGAIVRAFYE